MQIIKADVFRRIKQDSAGDLNVLVGKVVMKQNKTLIYCDSAIQNVKINQVEAFGNIHINDADSVHTYSQYLKYKGDIKIAELKKKVKSWNSMVVHPQKSKTLLHPNAKQKRKTFVECAALFIT
mgnify:CR=1 FL=1